MGKIAVVREVTLVKTMHTAPEEWEGEFEGHDIYIRTRHQRAFIEVDSVLSPFFDVETDSELHAEVAERLPKMLGLEPGLTLIRWENK